MPSHKTTIYGWMIDTDTGPKLCITKTEQGNRPLISHDKALIQNARPIAQAIANQNKCQAKLCSYQRKDVLECLAPITAPERPEVPPLITKKKSDESDIVSKH